MGDNDEIATVKLPITRNFHFPLLFGQQCNHQKLLERSFNVIISPGENNISIKGNREAAERVAAILRELESLASEGYPLSEKDVSLIIKKFGKEPTQRLREALFDTILISSTKRKIFPKTPNQKSYIDGIRNYDLVIAIGPAGTGKTYLAMAMAVAALLKKEVVRIILARPAVEAGESLGFLPGDMYQKVNPYLRPLYDALYDMLDVEKANRLVERGSIEIAPIAYMRGRTLNDSFIILDEAQNTTPEQMKMFLTRLGYNSKAVITGDITQIDLPRDKISGLVQIREVLAGIPRIHFIEFNEKDVVRHDLVQAIVKAYEKYEAKKTK